MNTMTAGFLFVAVLVGALALTYRPFGDYMYRVYDSDQHLRVERGIYRLVRVDPNAEQRWATYLRSVLAFSVVSVLFLYGFLRLQGHLLLSLGFQGMEPDQAFNTAASFVTNTDWQSYSGESTLGHLVQMAGLAVQNFVSAAVGMAVAIALVRGFARRGTDHLGNFWVDLTRTCLRILLPISIVAAIVLIAGGAIQSFHGARTVGTLVGAKQSITGGPVASQEVIKELGTNGGGFYNVNSAHPFENPTSWTNWLEIYLLPAIGFSLPRTFGRMVGNSKQGLRRGYGDAVRGPELRSIRQRHDRHVDGRGGLLPRLLHEYRRRGAAAEHDARRDRAGRDWLGPLRDAHPRNDHRLRGRTDDRPDTGVLE